MTTILLAALHAILLAIPTNPYLELRTWSYNNHCGNDIFQAPNEMVIDYESWCEKEGTDPVLHHLASLREERYAE